jgi:hypothetical protein
MVVVVIVVVIVVVVLVIIMIVVLIVVVGRFYDQADAQMGKMVIPESVPMTKINSGIDQICVGGHKISYRHSYLGFPFS